MSINDQSAPTETRSLFARREKGKRIHKKEFPKNVVAGRNGVCEEATEERPVALYNCHPGCSWYNTTKHKSCHLLLLVCMSIDD
jgi:hypothetical protein